MAFRARRWLSRSELVLGRAGDLVLLGELLCGDAHVRVLEGVAEELDDAVLDLVVAEPVARARLAQVVGQARHVLGAAGDNHVGVARLDVAGGRVDGLEAAAAEAIDVEGGRLDRDAGLDARDAREVGVLGHLADDAHDDLVDVARVNAGAADGLGDDGGAEFVGGGIGERTVERADGRANAAGEDNVFHGETFLGNSGANRRKSVPVIVAFRAHRRGRTRESGAPSRQVLENMFASRCFPS